MAFREIIVSTQQIIGGMFGIEKVLPAEQQSLPPFLRPEDMLLTNARSALWLLVRHLQPRNVWLPAFICPDVIHAIENLCNIRFFDAEEHTWLASVSRDDVVVILDQFGVLFKQQDWQAWLRDQSAIVVEDACQALLTSGVGKHADYVIFSPRKFVGVVDGGILRACHGRSLPSDPLKEAPSHWFQLAKQAAEERAVFDRTASDHGWFSLFRQAEETQPCGPFAMSQLSQAILRSVTDWTQIGTRRLENYLKLLELLSAFALLPKDAATLGFPIVVENRDEVLHALYAERIYPPVHWRLAGHVPPEFTEAHRLSARIMTLPCDQRYDAADMQRMAEIVLRKGRPCSAT